MKWHIFGDKKKPKRGELILYWEVTVRFKLRTWQPYRWEHFRNPCWSLDQGHTRTRGAALTFEFSVQLMLLCGAPTLQSVHDRRVVIWCFGVTWWAVSLAYIIYVYILYKRGLLCLLWYLKKLFSHDESVTIQWGSRGSGEPEGWDQKWTWFDGKVNAWWVESTVVIKNKKNGMGIFKMGEKQTVVNGGANQKPLSSSCHMIPNSNYMIWRWSLYTPLPTPILKVPWTHVCCHSFKLINYHIIQFLL